MSSRVTSRIMFVFVTAAAASGSAAILLGAAAAAPAAASAPEAPAEAAAPASPGPLARVAALAGAWRVAGGDSVTEEIWTAPAGRNMTGLFRMLGPDGSPLVLELLTLAPTDDGGIELRFRHFDAELQPWAAERDAPLILRAVPASADDFAPARVRFRSVAAGAAIEELIYDLRQPGHLHVTVDLAAADRADIELHFTRTDIARP